MRQPTIAAEVDYYVALDDLWQASMGTAIHGWLEDAEDDNHELHLSAEISADTPEGVVPVTFRGTIDHYDPETRRITDYKTVSGFTYYDPERKTNVPREFPDPKHVIQVNLYAHLCRLNGIAVDEAQIWYVVAGKPRRSKEKDTTIADFLGISPEEVQAYDIRWSRPSVTKRMVPVELWPEQHAEQALMELAEPLALAKATGTMPHPALDAEENFQCRFCPLAVQLRCRQLEEQGI